MCLRSRVDADSFCHHGDCANTAYYEESADMAASIGYTDVSNRSRVRAQKPRGRIVAEMDCLNFPKILNW